MNSRERVLAIGLITVILVAGGVFLFHQMFYLPLQEREANIASLKEEIETTQDHIRQARAEQSRLDYWRHISLPPDIDLARREYEKYLSELLRESGFSAGSFSVTPKPADTRSSPILTGKKPVYTRLDFIVLGHANLASFVKMLEGFYRTGLLQQIKNVSIQRPITLSPQQQPGELDINLTVEALIVNGTANRPTLMPGIDRRLLAVDLVAGWSGGPVGLALLGASVGSDRALGPKTLAQPSRDYGAVADKNIFLGRALDDKKDQEVELTRFVYLTDITQNHRFSEAFFYDRYNNRKTRLRNSAGFDRFRVTDAEGKTVVQGKVIRIDERDLYFQTKEKNFSIHVGQSLEEALKTPLSTSQVKSSIGSRSRGDLNANLKIDKIP